MPRMGTPSSKIRGSGRGEISVSGRRLPFAYAFVYSRPGWLRADVRPDVAMLPPSSPAEFWMNVQRVRLAASS